MDKSIEEVIEMIPAVADVADLKETMWMNDKRKSEWGEIRREIGEEEIADAERRLERFAPYIEKAFPETEESHGIIESPIRMINGMREFLNNDFQSEIEGDLWIKLDSHLPIVGSVKARGGIYEVLKYAETLVMEAGLLKESDDYSILTEPRFIEFFSQYTIQAGSTGNLGLSIGIISAKLGFQVIVHMSKDAKEWKKKLLRSKGVQVIEYENDYSKAVEEGRKNSDEDEKSYFVDDENSKSLFLGYAVAGKRLKKQLEEKKIIVDSQHPLFVYIPCGIGGAPGGITYGLKGQFHNDVHCFFVEPTQASCMLLGMATGEHDKVSVKDLGISGLTEADGLAVGRPSAFVGKLMEDILSGIATIDDKKLYCLMKKLMETEKLFIEPSACASFGALIRPQDMKKYVMENNLQDVMKDAVHIVWATGGSLVPQEMVEEYLTKC